MLRHSESVIRVPNGKWDMPTTFWNLSKFQHQEKSNRVSSTLNFRLNPSSELKTGDDHKSLGLVKISTSRKKVTEFPQL